MRLRTAIFYYTNNLLCKEILKTTVEDVIRHAEENKCELIITSHYPVLSKSTEKELPVDNVSSAFNIVGDAKQLDKYVVKDLRIDGGGRATNYVVVPQKQKSPTTIFDQILLSMEVSHGSNIVLMEHDCLYPKNYVSVVNHALNDSSFTYCTNNSLCVSWKGYFKNPFLDFYLSSCSKRGKISSNLLKFLV